MPTKDHDDAQPTQKTPKGLEIPVPTREDFFRNMEKVTPPVEHQPARGERDSSDD